MIHDSSGCAGVSPVACTHYIPGITGVPPVAFIDCIPHHLAHGFGALAGKMPAPPGPPVAFTNCIPQHLAYGFGALAGRMPAPPGLPVAFIDCIPHRTAQGSTWAPTDSIMDIPKQIEGYLANLAEPTRADMYSLHHRILSVAPECRLWFLDGKDSKGKVVSNPSVGYGYQNIEYANGTRREFYQVGISANTAGITIYIMGLTDKTHLARNYASRLGKAKVTGYCIKFKRLSELNLDALDAVISDGFNSQTNRPNGSRSQFHRRSGHAARADSAPSRRR